MTDPPRLTIAVTTYERPEYLRDCLASICDQTLRDFRIAILDNASTRSYSDVLAEFSHLPIAYERNATNIGASRNIERAFTESWGSEFVIVFHDDDVMHPRMLEWEVGVLDRDPRLGFVATELRPFVDGAALPVDAWARDPLDTMPPFDVHEDATGLARALLADTDLCFGSVMYRSTALAAAKMDFEAYNMYWDRPFLLDIAKRAPTAVIREPLVLYRHHEAQDSRSDVLIADDLVALMRAYREALPAKLDALDSALFFRRSTRFMVDSYSLLADMKRPSLSHFLRAARRRGVMRLRDLTARDWAVLFRAGGFAWLPDAVFSLRKSLTGR